MNDKTRPGAGAEREETESALIQLRAYLAQSDLKPNTRLPPERELCETLGVTRGELRRALAVLEEQGELWRHVGKGTFVGARPVADFQFVAGIAAQTNPAEVMRARLAIEPEIAREAALHAKAADVETLWNCATGARNAETWRQYENWDNRLHRAVAQATHNALFLGVLDTLAAVRRTVVWARLREERAGPPADHHSFAEHEAIIRAIEQRDMNAAAEQMRQHLHHVQVLLLSGGRQDIEIRPPTLAGHQVESHGRD